MLGYLLIYTLFTFKSSKVVYLQWVFWNASCMFLCLHFNITFLTSIEFCMILMQFDIAQGELKLVSRLNGRNEFAKLRALCDFGPYLPSCLRAFVLYAASCLRALRTFELYVSFSLLALITHFSCLICGLYLHTCNCDKACH